MAKAIWVVSADYDDDQHVMGVFTSCRKMLDVLEQQYGKTLSVQRPIRSGCSYASGIRDGYTDFLDLRRYKLDELSRLNYRD